MSVSQVKIKNFRQAIFKITQQELELRAQMKRLYEQFILDVSEDPMAIRHVRQAYFQIQKHRIGKLIAEKYQFHPFFTHHPMKDGSEVFEDEDDDDLV